MDTAATDAVSQQPDTRQEAIRVEDLHKSFGRLEVLKGVDLTAHQGDVVAIIWWFGVWQVDHATVHQLP